MTSKILKRYPDIMSVKDVQDVLHIGRSTVYKLLKSGELRFLKIRTKYRIPKAYLLEFLNDKA